MHDDALARRPGQLEPAAGVQDRLRRLEAVTDLALSQLRVDELLDELLERVREVLEADTAAILLIDESRQFLVATAARGLEEEVRQGSRVPLGLGFAGKVAATRRPVAIGEVSPRTVVNPVLLYKGVRSMLGVPLIAVDEVLGVLHVGSLTHRDFNNEDTHLLEQAAERAATAIAAENARIDASAALALQRSLAPHRIPNIPGLDLAARYVPGSRSGVGGDWYDVFSLPDGLIGVTVGDVMGHGLSAATVMGRVRAVLRAYALRAEEPHQLLERLDVYLQHFEPGLVASAIYATLDTRTWTLRLASAGHLPPVLAQTFGQSRLLNQETGLLLGVDNQPRRTSVSLTLDPGTALCLFTDGLVEHRESDLETSLELVRRALALGPTSAEAMCADIMTRLIDDRPADDDVALLVLRREE